MLYVRLNAFLFVFFKWNCELSPVVSFLENKLEGGKKQQQKTNPKKPSKCRKDEGRLGSLLLLGAIHFALNYHPAVYFTTQKDVSFGMNTTNFDSPGEVGLVPWRLGREWGWGSHVKIGNVY